MRKKKFDKVKRSINVAVIFGVLLAVGVGLGVSGLVLTTGALFKGLSIAGLALSAIWGGTCALSIKRAVKASKAKKKAAALGHPHAEEAEAESEVSKRLAREQFKNNYKAGLKARKKAIRYLYQQSRMDINEENKRYKENNSGLKAEKKDAKGKIDKNLSYQTHRLNAASGHKNAIAKITSDREATLKSIPKKPGYKLAKGLSIAGATLSAILSVVGGAMIFSQFNKADVLANESNSTQAAFLDNQETTNNALGLSISGTELISAGIAATVAGQARKRRKQEIAEFDYSSVIKSAGAGDGDDKESE